MNLAAKTFKRLIKYNASPVVLLYKFMHFLNSILVTITDKTWWHNITITVHIRKNRTMYAACQVHIKQL